MVHRKSCYTLTFKTIRAQDRRNLYEENLNNRYLYEAIHRFHQPLPFDEEPCDCDVQEEQQKLDNSCKGKAPKRAQSQPRPSSSRPTTEPHVPLKGGSYDWPPLKHHTNIVTSAGSASKSCAFCGCDFALFRSPKNHGNEGMFDTTYHDDFKLMPGAVMQATGQEGINDTRLQKMEQPPGNSKGKLENFRPYKTRFEEGTKNIKKDNRRISSEDKEEGIRGVFKCHPILREYDLLPATMKPYRAAPDGSPYWNSQGDRVPEAERYRRSNSGLMLRNTRQSSSGTNGRAARLSASTGNLATQESGNSGNLRRVNSHGWRITNTRDAASLGRTRAGDGNHISQVLRNHGRWSAEPSGGLGSASPAVQWRCPACDRTATFRS